MDLYSRIPGEFHPVAVSWPVVHKVPCESLFGILDFVPKSIGISLELLGYWTVEQKPNVS